MRMRDKGIAGHYAKKFLPFAGWVLLVGSLGMNAFGQRATGSISGRVITEDGQPIPHAKVNIAGVGGVKKILAGRMEVVTDASGGFQADKLDPAAYSITASAPGYVAIQNEQTGSTSTRYVHVGETVTIRMQRGGIITGRVLNSSGEPVIGITVEATRVRDETGGTVTNSLNSVDLILGRQTDDRGVYRIYGLAPGTYVVSVGSGVLGFSLKPTPFAGR